MQKDKSLKLKKLKDEISGKDTSWYNVVEAINSQNKSIKELINAIKDQKLSVNIPDKIKVSNISDIKTDKVEFPKVQDVNIKNFPEQKEIQKVEIVDKKEKKETNFTELFDNILGNIKKFFIEMWSKGIEVSHSVKKPIYVMPVDEKGKVINPNFQVFGGGGGIDSESKKNLADINANTKINYAQKIDDTVVGITYIALAPIGSLESSAVWQCKKIELSNGITKFTWADGDDKFDNIATDLTALTYS